MPTEQTQEVQRSKPYERSRLWKFKGTNHMNGADTGSSTEQTIRTEQTVEVQRNKPYERSRHWKFNGANLSHGADRGTPTEQT